MFLLNSFRAQHDLISDTFTLPGDAGLSLIFSHFDGYSPMLDGSVRTKVAESSGSEKSGNIVVTINVKSWTKNPNYKNNIRIVQINNSVSIATGGLSLVTSLTAPRLLIDVTITLPASVGSLEIKTISLPVFIHSIERANDVVIHTDSSPISVEKVVARSLTVSSQSGSISFEYSSKQTIDKFTNISNSSGSMNLRSSIFSPAVSAETSSGGLGLTMTTTATELKIKNSSGSIAGEVEYVKDATSVSSYENSSGQLRVKLRGWTGFFTAESSSGSKKIGGQGLERWNDGWKKGDGESTAEFRTQSGSIKVEVQ